MNHIARHRIRGAPWAAWAWAGLLLAPGCVPTAGDDDDDDSAVAAGPDLEVSPLLVDFGEVGVRGMAERAVLLRSIGDAPVSASWILSDTQRFAVVDVDGDADAIEPGTTVTLLVRYVPGGVEHVLETLDIDSDDPDEPRITAQLRGDGVE